MVAAQQDQRVGGSDRSGPVSPEGATRFEVGQLLPAVTVGKVAHGGHCVARVDGRVVFVRHALPGEVVDVRVTEVSARLARGDAVAVSVASEHRRPAPCPIAERCGGCDFQHATPAYARELKRQVVAELLGHLAGYEFTGEVRAVEPAPFGWRRRMRYHVDVGGRPGLRAPRSTDVVPLPETGCLLAVPELAHPPLAPELAGGELLAVSAASGVSVGAVGSGPETVLESVAGRDYEVARTGFWQAHTAAPEVLVAAVLAGLAPRPGEVALDLFCGAGLFAKVLDAASATVWGVEGDRTAVRLARRNVPGARFVAGDVAKSLARLPGRADLVVLDPPRTGAGRRVLAAVAARRPRAIAYVACDPAALGRDLATAAELGYRTVSVEAYDLFPTTHHVECVATLERL